MSVTIKTDILQFPATQVPSADPNALDDYEEGLWSPALLTDGTQFTSVTYDALNGGRYVKIGRLVHVQGVLRTSGITVGPATGGLLIGGLPFAATADTGSTVDGRSTLAVSFAASWTTNHPGAARVLSGTTTAQLFYRTAANGASTGSAVADAATGAAANLLYFSGCYVAAQ